MKRKRHESVTASIHALPPPPEVALPKPSAPFPADPPARVAICVPVRNEATALPALLAAIARQARIDPRATTMCLFLDGCTDGTRAVAERHVARFPFALRWAETLAGTPANAGRARGAAMALAGDADILLTTDADSTPEPDWVAACLAALRGVDIVAGRIVREGTPCPSQDRIEAYYDRLYRMRRRADPVAWEAPPGHHFTSGANLGFRAAAYRALGGFAPVAVGEDARIVDDAGRAGLRVGRDRDCVVRTSSRRIGRAPGGLSMALRDLDGGTVPAVGHPDDAIWQYRLHAQARGGYEARAWGEVATALDLSADHVIGVARDCPNAEAFAMRIVPAPPGGMRQISLDEAEAVLRLLEARPLEGAA